MSKLPRFFRFILAAIMLLAALFLAAGSWFWVRAFYPGDRLDMKQRSAYGDRVFSEVAGFVDVGIYLQAVDFPYTWRKPEMIGDLYWPEIYRSREVFWSRDFTLIAIRTGRLDDPRLHFTEAYDFKSHRGYGHEGRTSEDEDARIRMLFDQRGGIGARVTEIVDEKDDQREESFPPAGWLPPLALLSAGIVGSLRIAMRRSLGVAAENRLA